MKYIKLAGGCLNQIPLDFRGNQDRILQAIQKAQEARVQVLCLPELAISGYGCEDAFFSTDVLERSLESLKQIIPHTEGLTLSVGMPLAFEDCLYNVVCMIHDKELLGFVAKQELAGDGIYYEPRWFKPWEENRVASYDWEEKTYPLGDLLFEIGEVRIGFEICEDAWTGIRPAQRHYLHKVDLILNPSASNFAFEKSRVRERLVTEASRAYNCTYVYSNLLGNEAGRIIYDGEILIAQEGNLLGRNQRFSFEEAQILTAVVDVDAIRISRRKSFNYHPQVPPCLIEKSWDWSTPVVEHEPSTVAPYESKDEEFMLAETLALFDYMRKSRSRGFVLSLSGGADSSATAVLCVKALERAHQELGEEFWEKVSYAGINQHEPLVQQFCTFVYQATENSSEETLESAEKLAGNLGARFLNWDVQPLLNQYTDMVAHSLGRELTWEQDDLALQNIQARLRAPGIWMLANIQGALLLTTSNRSEAAVGYATMDGDTAGGLAPLGGMDKASLLSWLVWAEDNLRIPALSYVNSLKPTAELRPAELFQSDEKDLMPYDMLEQIESFAIGEYQSPVEVFRSLQGTRPDRELKAYIRKFFTLWSRNQWKRERYAPSFHLDDKNLDPKTWCRFPILSAGFRNALLELDAYVEKIEREKSIQSH
ncbi:MAG: NAD(+) synthase [Bacteroidota bacterium]